MGAWESKDGVKLRIARDGRIEYKEPGFEVRGAGMSGWKDPPEPCQISGRVCCCRLRFDLRFVGGDGGKGSLITVDGRVFRGGHEWLGRDAADETTDTLPGKKVETGSIWAAAAPPDAAEEAAAHEVLHGRASAVEHKWVLDAGPSVVTEQDETLRRDAQASPPPHADGPGEPPPEPPPSPPRSPVLSPPAEQHAPPCEPPLILFPAAAAAHPASPSTGTVSSHGHEGADVDEYECSSYYSDEESERGGEAAQAQPVVEV